MDTSEVIKQIDQARDAILSGKLWQDGETLSSLIVKLAALNSYLGDQIAAAQLEAEQADSACKYLRDSTVARLTRSDDMAVNKATVEATTSPEYREALETAQTLEFRHQMLKLKSNDTNKMIDAMRSKLSQMRSDRQNNEA